MNTYLEFWVRSLVIGLAIAAPVGPIGALCIQRTVVGGRMAGLVSGLGAATADAVYGAIAGLGITFVADFLVNQRAGLNLAGGLFLALLGVRSIVAPAANPARERGPGRWWADYASTFFLTLANPMTVLAFVAVFAGLGVVDTGGDFRAAAAVILGVFTGSVLWWLLLSSSVGLLRERLALRHLAWINRAAGGILVVFALQLLLQLL
jgi:threonine/homoserine/homoserine lactone efflux protein